MSYMKGENAAGQYADMFVQQNSQEIWTMSIEDFVNGLSNIIIPAALKQGKGTVKDYLVEIKQLSMQADYNTKHHTRTLIRSMWQGLRNEVIE